MKDVSFVGVPVIGDVAMIIVVTILIGLTVHVEDVSLATVPVIGDVLMIVMIGLTVHVKDVSFGVVTVVNNPPISIFMVIHRESPSLSTFGW